MSMAGGLSLDMTGLIRGIEEAKQKVLEQVITRAMLQTAMQMLVWMCDGSPQEPIKPPIRWGVLRGSASAFVGSVLVGVSPALPRAGGGRAAPATSYSAPDDQITIVFNTAYAAKMHEWKGGWGPYTLQDGNAGSHWITKHIVADKEALMRFFASRVKEGLNAL